MRERRASFLLSCVACGVAFVLPACGDDDDDAGGCPASQIECDGLCVSTDDDPANCGACGSACGAGEVCVAGDCALECPTGLTECEGSCADTDNDPAHCGDCDTACGATDVCVAGDCVPMGGGCPDYLMDCGGVCADVDNDPEHCGDCDVTCDVGDVCVAGECTAPPAGCPEELTDCDGACVDTDYDPANCGGCGQACDDTNASIYCLAGVCTIDECADGFQDCNEDGLDGCEIDLDGDEANCGGCGVVCEGDSTCDEGFCSLDPFRVLSLSATCTAVEHDPITSDDRGGIAASGDYFFYMGDGSGGRFAIADASGLQAWPLHDGMVNDLSSGAVFAMFAGDTELVNWTGPMDIDNLRELNPEDGTFTGVQIDLSQPISVETDGDSSRWGVYNGWGVVVLRADTDLWLISFASGRVRDLGEAPDVASNGCESWAHWGIAEYYEGSIHLLYRDWNGETIARTTLATGETTEAAAFEGLSDMCSIGFSPSVNRWVFHHEGGGQWGDFSEAAGTCEATWDAPGIE